jgi:hypothetical protein
MNEEPGRIQPRSNIVNKRELSFRKRYEAVGYWVMLAIVFMLAIWFFAASASDRGDSEDAHATVIATLFVPETATAEAEESLGTTAE